jgi:hypothetical protein
LLPSAVARESAIEVTAIVWLALAPTWKFWALKEPSSRVMPLNEVWPETRVISAINWLASASSEARSVALLVPLADWTASSRRRCRLLPTSARAPSAVCASEMPSLALRAAWFRPRIWAVIRWEIARPAESSRALLMRMPDERRCRAMESAFCETLRERCELSEAMLVLMTWGMRVSWPKRLVGGGRCAPDVSPVRRPPS